MEFYFDSKSVQKQRLSGQFSSIRVNKNFLFLLTFLILQVHQVSVQQQQQQNYHLHTAPLTVTTKYGILRGLRLQFSSSSYKHLDPVTAFLGIPYASPPVNAYRFMPPVAPLPWSGVRSAVALQPACPQRFPAELSNRTQALQIMTALRFNFLKKLEPFLANQSEDCLYLNIYVPTLPYGDEIRPGKFAILFVIHGESFDWGSGNEFDGSTLASIGHHIVVTLNYRLGLLGFLKTSNQQSNFGLLDVMAGLHWIRENGDSFGGDKNRITVLGYRSGAVIANLLLVSQISKGLFQRAILISGSVLSPWGIQRDPEDIASQVAKELGCSGRLPLSHPESDLAPCLRRKPLEDLLKASTIAPKFLPPFAPFVDKVLVRNPRNLLEEPTDQFLSSSIMIGFTSSESIQELSEVEIRTGFESEGRDRMLRTLVRNLFSWHLQEIYSIIKNEYTDWNRPNSHPIPLRDAIVEALSDALVISPSLQILISHSKRRKMGSPKRTFLFHFSHTSSRDTDPVYERLGSLEGELVPYIMGLPITNNIPPLGVGHTSPGLSPWSSQVNFTRQDSSVSEQIIFYLSNFVKTGDPNRGDVQDWPSSQPDSSVLREDRHKIGNEKQLQNAKPGSALYWDAFDPNTQSYLNFGSKPKVRTHYRGHKMALWINLIPQIHTSGGTEVSPAHHSFRDGDNPNFFIGKVRNLQKTQLSFEDSGEKTTTSNSNSISTTECLETTRIPHGTQSNFVLSPPDESESRLKFSEKTPGDSAGINGADFGYSTALTITITVGICLICLNLLLFFAILCHKRRKEQIGGSSNTSNSLNSPENPPGSSSSNSMRNCNNKKFQDPSNYKWTPVPTNPNTSNSVEIIENPDYENHHQNLSDDDVDPSNDHDDEKYSLININQYPAAACAQLDFKWIAGSPNSHQNQNPGDPEWVPIPLNHHMRSIMPNHHQGQGQKGHGQGHFGSMGRGQQGQQHHNLSVFTGFSLDRRILNSTAAAGKQKQRVYKCCEDLNNDGEEIPMLSCCETSSNNSTPAPVRRIMARSRDDIFTEMEIEIPENFRNSPSIAGLRVGKAVNPGPGSNKISIESTTTQDNQQNQNQNQLQNNVKRQPVLVSALKRTSPSSTNSSSNSNTVKKRVQIQEISV